MRRRRRPRAPRRRRAAGGPRTRSTRRRAMTWLAMRSASSTAPSSKPLKTSAIGFARRRTTASTSTGADEQRDLGARADRDVHGEVHLVLRGEVDRDPVLGRVADDRDDDQADEELRSPIASEASEIEPTRISDMTPTATPANASMMTERLTVHGFLDVVLLAVLGLKRSLVRPQREEQAGDVGDQQDDRHGERHVLEVGAEVHRLLADPRQRRRPATSWKIVGMTSATAASSSIDACTLARRAVERLLLAAPGRRRTSRRP